MAYARKLKPNRTATGEPLALQRLAVLDPALSRHDHLRADLTRFTSRTPTVQRQRAAPALRALQLHRQETDRVADQRQTLQRQLDTLGSQLPLAAPIQREASHPAPVPKRPKTPADWVMVLQRQVEQVEGQRLDARQFAHHASLQRQVAQALAQGFRSDRGPAQTRYDTYGSHLATLQRHEISAPVARIMMNLVPAGERRPLQRAADEALQRFQAEQRAAERADLGCTLQRHLADLEEEETQPVLHRIQARRGAGNPLPEAIRRHLEQGLNVDLNQVRIHDDAEAHGLAKSVNAIAFTSGNDIFFQSGRYNPNTQSGLELLAHEVTHTVQQTQGKVGPGVDPDAGLEAEARRAGARLANLPVKPSGAVRRLPSPTLLPPARAVQRQAAGGGSKVIQALANAISTGDLQKALTLLRGMTRDQQAKAMMEMMRRFRGRMGPGVAEGLQAMIDGLSQRIPDVIRKTVRKPVNPGDWNPPGKQPIPYYIGTSAHNAIAQHYETVHAAEQVFTNTRPMTTILGRAASKLTQAEALLKPDIVNMDRRHLYEIKSRSQAGLAVAEAAMYLELFRKAGVKMDLGPINDPGTIGIIPAPGGHYAFQAIAPGAIVYDYRKGRYDPKGVPVPAPAPAPAPSRQSIRTPAPAPLPAPGSDPVFMKKLSEATGLTGTALIIYFLISEGSRLFPPRNLVPIP